MMFDLRNAARAQSAPVDYAAIISSGGRGWLCHLEGKLRGFSVADPATRRLDVFVDPDFGRNGIGRALHNPAVDWLFELSSLPIWTLAAPQSKGQKFLYSAGWKLADIEDNGEFRFDLDPERWAKRKKKF